MIALLLALQPWNLTTDKGDIAATFADFAAPEVVPELSVEGHLDLIDDRACHVDGEILKQSDSGSKPGIAFGLKWERDYLAGGN